MNTFGPIDWKDYYKVPKVAHARPCKVEPMADSPCRSCVAGRSGHKCGKGLDPDMTSSCRRFTEWGRKWWSVVTGRRVFGIDREGVSGE